MIEIITNTPEGRAVREFTPTTDDIREAWIVAPGMDAEWDRWFDEIRGEIWEQGHASPRAAKNPYWTEQVPRIGSRGIDYSQLADFVEYAEEG